MPTYRYRCTKHHEFTVWRSIHEDNLREFPCEECSRIAVQVMSSPAIAADALPNKKHGVRAIDAREKRWDKDMPAYYRLRKEGLQPRGIDGSAEWEAKANSQIELEMGKVLGKEKDVRRAEEISSELLDTDVTSEGKKIGSAKRTAA